jgi:hypothetical protein
MALSSRVRKHSNLAVIVGVFWLVAGLLFYVLIRKQMGIFGDSSANSHKWLTDCIPSFFHAFAFTCISVGYGWKPRSAWKVWVVTGSLFEALQGIVPLFGTFDRLDLLANLIGASLAVVVVGDRRSAQRHIRRTVKASIWGVGIVTCVATSKAKDPNPYPADKGQAADFEPVYMAYDDLRQAFKVEGPREITNAGKTISIGSILLISETNIGIHVQDNTDTGNRKPLYFINLPGNLDLSAKGSTLYADSFIDVVLIQISEKEAPVLLSRKKDVFNWYAYQAILKYKDRIDPRNLDPTLGVITGVTAAPIATKDAQR